MPSSACCERVRPATAALLIAVVVAGTVPVPLHGQAAEASTPPSEFELTNLRTPTSPAFAILGIAPTAVSRPTTPRALALELLSETENGSVIPNNYALEAAPYWLRPRPTLSFAQYTRPTAAQSLRQSFAVSFATSRLEGEADTVATSVALGLRVEPIGGRPSAAFDAMVASLDTMQRARIPIIRRQADALDEIDDADAGILDARAGAAAARSAGDAARVRQLEARVDSLRARRETLRAAADAIEEELRTQADSMRALATAMGGGEGERVGLFMELATAVAASFPESSFESGKLARIGAWGTVSYRLEEPRLDVIALLRYQRHVLGEDQNSLDVGGRLFWLHERLGISGEFVNRTVFELGDAPSDGSGTRSVTFASSNRAVAVIDYRARDGLYVTTSFGQDWRPSGAERHPLVAVFGVSLQWGDRPVVELPR